MAAFPPKHCHVYSIRSTSRVRRRRSASACRYCQFRIPNPTINSLLSFTDGFVVGGRLHEHLSLSCRVERFEPFVSFGGNSRVHLNLSQPPLMNATVRTYLHAVNFTSILNLHSIQFQRTNKHLSNLKWLGSIKVAVKVRPSRQIIRIVVRGSTRIPTIGR